MTALLPETEQFIIPYAELLRNTGPPLSPAVGATDSSTQTQLGAGFGTQPSPLLEAIVLRSLCAVLPSAEDPTPRIAGKTGRILTLWATLGSNQRPRLCKSRALTS